MTTIAASAPVARRVLRLREARQAAPLPTMHGSRSVERGITAPTVPVPARPVGVWGLHLWWRP